MNNKMIKVHQSFIYDQTEIGNNYPLNTMPSFTSAYLTYTDVQHDFHNKWCSFCLARRVLLMVLFTLPGYVFSFLWCPIMCLYVMSSVLWCPLRFQHKNDVRFVFSSSWCRRAHVLFTLFVFAC